MEKIQENIICKQACSYVFVQENHIKAHVLMYLLHLVLTFIPHYIIMVKGLLSPFYPEHHSREKRYQALPDFRESLGTSLHLLS